MRNSLLGLCEWVWIIVSAWGLCGCPFFISGSGLMVGLIDWACHWTRLWMGQRWGFGNPGNTDGMCGCCLSGRHLPFGLFPGWCWSGFLGVCHFISLFAKGDVLAVSFSFHCCLRLCYSHFILCQPYISLLAKGDVLTAR